MVDRSEAHECVTSVTTERVRIAMTELRLKFEMDTGAAFEVEVEDVGKGNGEVYMRHEDVLLDMKGWKFEDFWGNAYEVIYAPDWRCKYIAFLQVWRQQTIARIEGRDRQSA